ncbi:glutaredoxin [Eucalyptus grandis]|uniref:glutaredoxin n=1 Tax=Eucalyptus grandis TaxID=71139 RepID=UPI00192EEA6D|nr:glutaredoxin [Eucalyptus grandis]
MGSIFSSSSSGASKEELASAADKAKEVASSAPVVVFSKTYRGYCQRVKHLLTQLGVSYKVVELDKEGDGAVVQLALADWTGLRTVPNVFIGGNHIGGCDSVTEKHQAGQLVPLLRSAGAVKT